MECLIDLRGICIRGNRRDLLWGISRSRVWQCRFVRVYRCMIMMRGCKDWDEQLLPNTPRCIQKLFAGIFWFRAIDICRPSARYMRMVGPVMPKNAHQKNPPTFPFLNRGISTCPGMRDAKSIAETLLANAQRARMGKSIAELC